MSLSHTLEQARAAKPRVLELFSPLAPVVGVGITRIDGGYGVKVNLREAPPAGTQLPKTLEGIPIQVEVVGPVRKR